MTPYTESPDVLDAQRTAPFSGVPVQQPVELPTGLSPELRPTIAPTARRINSAGLFTIVALAIMTIGLLYLVQTSHVASLGYEVSRLEQERLEKSLENQQLTYDIARQQSLPAIERIAREDLEMEPVEQVGTRLYITVPAPTEDELPLPEPEAGTDLSLTGRIWARLTGTAHASNPTDAEGEAEGSGE
jgi:cell division protein FtsL